MDTKISKWMNNLKNSKEKIQIFCKNFKENFLTLNSVLFVLIITLVIISIASIFIARSNSCSCKVNTGTLKLAYKI